MGRNRALAKQDTALLKDIPRNLRRRARSIETESGIQSCVRYIFYRLTSFPRRFQLP